MKKNFNGTAYMIHRDDILVFLKNEKEKLTSFGLKEIGLFGSFSRNEATEWSDIDVAIRLENDFLARNDAWAYFDLLERIKNDISHRFHRKSDVFDLDSRSDIRDRVDKETIYV